MDSIEQATGGNTAAVDGEKFKLYSVDQLMTFPPAVWLIDGVIDSEALAVLYGPPRSAKSFTALDWALCIATKTSWHGREVKKKGRVVYVLGEGGRGIWKRVRAWMQHHNIEKASRALFVMEAPRMLQTQDVDQLTARIKEQVKDPALVVIDTLATAFGGGDENSSKEMGAFVEACRRLQKELKSTVLVVHHSTKSNPESERGSGALRGGADVMIMQRMTQSQIVTIRNTKQKDEEEFENITLQLKKVTLTGLSMEASLTSCVLVEADKNATAGYGHLNLNEFKTLKALAAFPGGESDSTSWRSAMEPVVKKKTFDNWRKKLLNLGLVEPVQGKQYHYRATTEGTASANGTPKAA